MELSVSPDLTVYLTGRAACLAARWVTDTSRAAVTPGCPVAGVAAEWRAGACAAALAAGALAMANAAARPASAGAARIGSRRRVRVRTEFREQPKGHLPEMVALIGKVPARCAGGAKCGHPSERLTSRKRKRINGYRQTYNKIICNLVFYGNFPGR